MIHPDTQGHSGTLEEVERLEELRKSEEKIDSKAIDAYLYVRVTSELHGVQDR